MSRSLRITVDVEIADATDPNEVGEAVFNFLASDPDDLIPQIECVNFWDAVVLP